MIISTLPGVAIDCNCFHIALANNFAPSNYFKIRAMKTTNEIMTLVMEKLEAIQARLDDPRQNMNDPIVGQ